jgi:hypothetical protein
LISVFAIQISCNAPGGRPMFFKPKLDKETKNGFKEINHQKNVKKIGVFVDVDINT